MVNKLRGLPEGARKVIANSPAILDFMVAASRAKKYGLIDDLRATESVDAAQAFAIDENKDLGAVSGKTVDDVYDATGGSESGPEWDDTKCAPGSRWDPITQTCVPV